MHILTTHVRTGDRVVVQFDAPPVAPRERGDRWLTLVPEGSDEEFVGERAVIDVGAAEASISTAHEGAYELRLVDGSPRHLSRVVARTRVEVARAVLAHDEAPAWYW